MKSLTLRNDNVKKFVNVAVLCKQLRCFSLYAVHKIDWRRRVNYEKGEPSNCRSFNRNTVEYFAKIAQVTLMERRDYLRNMPHIFKEELLRTA